MTRHNNGDRFAIPGVTRRAFLQLSATALAAPLVAPAQAGSPLPRVWVYHPLFADPPANPGGGLILNAEDEQASAWQTLRRLEPVDSIAGITRWSDFLTVRGHLESQHMRLAALIQRGQGFHWLFRQRHYHQRSGAMSGLTTVNT